MLKVFAESSILRWVLALVLLLISSTASAQNVTEQGLEFPLPLDFAPPGARAASLGRAFIGLADDATAAAANPAGLVRLPRPEISYHFRATSSETFARQFFVGLPNQTSKGTVVAPTFISVVMPVIPQTLAISGFYSQEVGLRNTFEQRLLLTARVGEISQRWARQSNDLTVSQLGVAAGLAVTERFAIGGAIRSSRAALEHAEDTAFLDQPFLFRRRIDANVSKPTWNFGLTMAVAPPVAIGAVYRRGATFRFSGTSTLISPATQTISGGDEFISELVQSVTIPDSYGLGLSIRPSEGRFTVTFDVVRVEYSDMLRPIGADRIGDATELHGGIEYRWTLPGNRLLALRGGAYTDPGHHPFEDQVIDFGRNVVANTDQVFATAGAGVVLGSTVQLDFAVRHSKDTSEVSLSTVVRF